MKVIIANPPWPGEGYGTRSNIRWPHRRGDKVLTFPIYLAYAVSILEKEGYEVIGLDAVDLEEGIPKFVKRVKREQPSLILLETSTPSILHDIETAKRIKREVGCKVVLCGSHVTYYAADIIQDFSFIDFILKGEFDFSIKDLCKAIEGKKSFKEVSGLVYRSMSGIAINPITHVENVDELPYPDRKQFKIENYQQAFFGGKRTGLVISSRGCPYHCTFCLWPETLYGHKHRQRNPKNVINEIEHLVKNYGVDEIYFDDDTFIIKKQWIIVFCNELMNRKLNLPWLCMGRVNTVDYEILKLMKNAGCQEIFYGFESGSQDILNDSNKAITKDQVLKAVRLTQKAGIRATGSFVIGLPNENKSTIKETIDFAIKLHADYVQFTIAAPFPGTQLFEQVKNAGLLEYNSWEDFDGCHGPILRTKSLTKDELVGLQKKMYKQYYFSIPVIIQNLKSMRSVADVRRLVRGFNSLLSRFVFYKK